MMTAGQLAAALAAGRTTAVALVQSAIAAVGERDGQIRSFTRLDVDGALAAARASDLRRKTGAVRGPLDGLPVAVKDNIAVAGLPCPAGTRALATTVPDTDATVVARLRAAGAVVLGMLNMHEGALGSTTDNPWWGRCDNPRMPGHTPGGSSGGSAAAVAAGFVPLTLGTDTMGSVRIPAACCGTWALKPTRGLVPRTGLLQLSWTLDTIGPLAADAEGLALMLEAIAGPDPADPFSRALPGPDARAMAPWPQIVVAIPHEAALQGCEPAVRQAHENAVAALRDAGATIRTLPLAWDPGPLRRAGLLVCEAEGAVLLQDALARDPDGFSGGFRQLLAYGAQCGSIRLALAYRLLAETGAAARRAMEEFDAFLLPTSPQRAFRHDQPTPADQADLTALANVAGLPAVAFPVEAADGGAPASVQLVGPAFSDRRLLLLAQRLEERITA